MHWLCSYMRSHQPVTTRSDSNKWEIGNKCSAGVTNYAMDMLQPTLKYQRWSVESVTKLN